MAGPAELAFNWSDDEGLMVLFSRLVVLLVYLGLVLFSRLVV